jgi:LytS/YehU family sensor histidine kinase
VVLQFLSDWQYRDYLNGGDFWKTFIYRVKTTPFLMLEYYIYYRLAVPLLLQKKNGLFFLSVLLFIIYLEFHLYFLDWLKWQASILSGSTKETANYSWDSYSFPKQSLHLTLVNLLSVTGFAYFLNRWDDEKLIQKLKEQQLESELNFLKIQVQPHFFFNTLNNIYTLTIQKSDKAAPLIAKHAETMRHVLYESVKTQVKLKKEIDFLKSYVDVESMHYSETMDITFDTQGINDAALIEPMLLLPYVENAFKHGIRQETAKGYVHIVISLEENELFIEISNSKPENIQKEVNGIGLLNASKRLQMLYPDKHKIEIMESGHSYELRLSLILKTND